MRRDWFRKFLYGLLLASALFAAAAWFLPYDGRPDPAARFKILATQVKRDRSNYWLTVHLKKSGTADHDLTKPVRLLTSDSREIEPADTTFIGEIGPGTTEIWLKFWLESADLDGRLQLRINDGRLIVKSTPTVPSITDGGMRTFTTSGW